MTCIEKTLPNYQKELKQDELAQSFRRAANDKDVMNMSEESLADVLQY